MAEPPGFPAGSFDSVQSKQAASITIRNHISGSVCAQPDVLGTPAASAANRRAMRVRHPWSRREPGAEPCERRCATDALGDPSRRKRQ